MSKKIIADGDRLISVFPPGDIANGAHVTWKDVLAIYVRELPGPTGYYFVAVIVYDSDAPDKIIPLHMAQSFEVQNG